MQWRTMAVELIESSKMGSRVEIDFCIAYEELAEKKAANDISFSWLLLKSNEESCFIHKSIPFRLFVFEKGMVSVLFNGSGFVFLAGKIFVYDSVSDGFCICLVGYWKREILVLWKELFDVDEEELLSMLSIATHVNRPEYKDGGQIISASLYLW